MCGYSESLPGRLEHRQQAGHRLRIDGFLDLPGFGPCAGELATSAREYTRVAAQVRRAAEIAIGRGPFASRKQGLRRPLAQLVKVRERGDEIELRRHEQNSREFIAVQKNVALV